MWLKCICMLPELCMCVYVPTQVDASNANDKDAVVAIDQIAPILEVLPNDDKDATVDAAVAVDQSVPVPSVFAESDNDNNGVAGESPSKRQKLVIDSDELAPEVPNEKIYRSMYYKQGLCLK